jgi:L-lysine exporter family protein LysE/ArgO
MLAAFIHGFILAFGLIIPLGVQNFFIFSQGTVSPKFIRLIPVVLTACLCDSALILLAVLGVSVVVLNLLWMKTLLMLAGIIFLVYMGYLTWRKKAEPIDKEGVLQISIHRVVTYTLMISLLNPHAILDTIGVIGTSSLRYQGQEKAAFTLACMIVSWVWFFFLAVIGRYIGYKDQSGRFINLLNKVSAIVMWAAAIYMIKTI